ncbi:MAG: hypothetical protein ABI298_05850 [Acidimicrobiales bacterium]
MGTSGDKPRKPRRRMERVSKYADASGNPLAGLTGSGDGMTGPGSGHGPPTQTHSVGKVGEFFLWCLGRRKKLPPVEPGQSSE